MENPVAEPSISELKAMLAADEGGSAEENLPVSDTASADSAAVDEKAAADPGAEAEKQLSEVEEELPKGVQKRIAKEVERQAEYDRRIAEARKATEKKKQELDALTANSGSDPVKTTAPDASQRPKKPQLSDFKGTMAEFMAASEKYEQDLETWLESSTRRTVTDELKRESLRQDTQKVLEKARQEHGADFSDHLKVLAENTSEAFQLAVSGMEDWSRVALHLAKNPDEARALDQKFQTNPFAATAALGKLEARLIEEAKPSEHKKLPEPLKPVAGGARGTVVPIDLDKADFRSFKKEVKRMLA